MQRFGPRAPGHVSLLALLAALPAAGCASNNSPTPSGHLPGIAQTAQPLGQDPALAARFGELFTAYRDALQTGRTDTDEVQRTVVAPLIRSAFAARQWECAAYAYLTTPLNSAVSGFERAQCAFLVGEAQILSDWDGCGAPRHHFQTALDTLTALPAADAQRPEVHDLHTTVAQRLRILDAASQSPDALPGAIAALRADARLSAADAALVNLLEAERMAESSEGRAQLTLLPERAVQILTAAPQLAERFTRFRIDLAREQKAVSETAQLAALLVDTSERRLRLENTPYLIPALLFAADASSHAGDQDRARLYLSRAVALGHTDPDRFRRWNEAARQLASARNLNPR